MPEFFEARKLRYEIHKQLEKRWEIAEAIGDGRDGLLRKFSRDDFEKLERQVLAKANALLAGDVAAVRVLREREREDGFLLVTEIFFRQSSGKVETPLTVTRYDGPVEPCSTAAELYARPACKAIGVLLRGYLDRQFLTALELLHFHPYIRKLNDANFGLVQGAVHQVATAQVKAGGTAKARAEALHKFLGEIERKARDALAEKRVPSLEDGDVGRFVERIKARYEGADRRFYLMFGIARQFQGSQTWFTKLDFALDTLKQGAPPELAPLLDEITAGCLDSAQLVMDLLGYHPNLSNALVALAQLAAGKGQGGSGAAATQPLRELIAAGKLPLVAEGLWERVIREFGKSKPLNRTDDKQEWNLAIKTGDDLKALASAPRKAQIEEAVKERMRRIRDAAALH